jgi:hypothetical protein
MSFWPSFRFFSENYHDILGIDIERLFSNPQKPYYPAQQTGKKFAPPPQSVKNKLEADFLAH